MTGAAGWEPRDRGMEVVGVLGWELWIRRLGDGGVWAGRRLPRGHGVRCRPGLLGVGVLG